MKAGRVLRNSPARIPRTRFSLHTITVPALPGHSDHARARARVSVASHQGEQRTSTLLQKTVSLLLRTLSTADDAVGPASSLFWSNILESSIAELGSASGQLPSKATIAVCGFDKGARSHDLVTALLEDPFTSDPTYSEMLRSRWKDNPSCINIEHGKAAMFAGELSSPSDWLQRFPYTIRLAELPDLSSLSNVSSEVDHLLLSSDILLLLCNPVITPLSDLANRAKHLLDKPNTILVLTSCSTSDYHHQFVSRTLSNMDCQPRQILFVDPRQALDAVTALKVNPTSPSAIDKYQRNTLGSRISTITVAISEILSPKNLSKSSIRDLREETALSQVYGSLSAGLRSVEATKKDIDRVAGEVDDLWSRVQGIQENTKHDILGRPGEDDKIEMALSLGMKEMNMLLGSLTFWNLVWRVDEIGVLVSAVVERQWCKGLESQLILQTGCLTSTQRELSISAFGLLSTASSLRSPVLENQLQQLRRSPAHTLTPDSLIQPIHDRRKQLIQHTTTKLHREAQSAVVVAFGGILSGTSLGWWLAFGEHILSLGVGTEMGTAIGSGALLAVSSVRWAVGKWERAKHRWAQDSARVGEGLTRDLQRTTQRTVEDDVTIIASTACRGMQDLIDRRRNEIHQLHGELHSLAAELDACAQLPASWTGRGLQPAKGINIE